MVLQSQTASAHKVSLFAYHEKGIVHTEAYFVDGTPCRNAKVTAIDDEGAVVAEGLTDKDGLFSFPFALTRGLTITVRASMGHGSEIRLAAEGADIDPDPPAGGETSRPDPEEVSTGMRIISLDEADIERIVEDRIGPIRDSVREVQKNQGKPTLGKILGGLGWIVGLAGAYLWGAARRREA